MVETGILFAFRSVRTPLHHRRKKFIVEKRSTVVLENFIPNIQTTLHSDEHAQLSLVVLLYQDNTFRTHCQSPKLLGAERPNKSVVQIRDLSPPQFIAAHDILEHVTSASPADRKQLDFVVFIDPIDRLCVATADTQKRCGKPRF